MWRTVDRPGCRLTRRHSANSGADRGRADDQRHHFVIVIPVADSPRHHNCLDSLLALAAMPMGWMRTGRFAKTAVLIADGSTEAVVRSAGNATLSLPSPMPGSTRMRLRHRGQLRCSTACAISTCAVSSVSIRESVRPQGQGMMRNIAYLRLAEMQAADADQRLLFSSIDADQEFRVKVPGGWQSVSVRSELPL